MNVLDNTSKTNGDGDKWLTAVGIYVSKFINKYRNYKDEVNNFGGWNNDLKDICEIKEIPEDKLLNEVDVFLGCTAGLRMKMERLSLILKEDKKTTLLDDFIDVIKDITKNAKDKTGKFRAADFAFRYIAGRAEGTFAYLVARELHTENNTKKIF